MRRISAASGETSTAPAASSAVAQAARARRPATIRSMPSRGADGEALDAADGRDLAGVLGQRRRRRRPRPRAGPIRERIARSSPASVDLDLAADLVHLAGGARAASSASGSVSSQSSAPSAEAQHPHVGLHVALAVEQRRVAALARLQRLDVVGQLPLQVLGRLGAGDEQLAALGAVEQAALLAQLPVLGVELDGRRASASHGLTILGTVARRLAVRRQSVRLLDVSNSISTCLNLPRR